MLKPALIARLCPLIRVGPRSTNLVVSSSSNVQFSRTICTSLTRPIHSTVESPSKYKELSPEEKVNFVDSKGQSKTMLYKELVEKAGSRNIVKIVKTLEHENFPSFKIMSDVELGIALKKQRSEVRYMGVKERVETSDGRIKQKNVELTENISDHDLEVHLNKMKKWLTKGNFIIVHIKSSDKKDKYTAVKEKIFDYFKDEPDLLGQGGSKLTIK